MSEPSPISRYTSVAIALHWLTVLALAGLIILAQLMYDPEGRPVEWVFQLHKSIGITLLGLVIARLLWRAYNSPPPLPAQMKPVEKKASHFVHIGFYGLLILIPLSGWAMVSLSPFSIATVLYGVLPWPHLPLLPDLALTVRQALYPLVKETHELLVWALIGLLIAHIAGAIKHELSAESGVLKRMIPKLFGRTEPPARPARGAFIAFGSALAFFTLVSAPPLLATALQSSSDRLAPAVQTSWQIDYSQSYIRFTGEHDGSAFTGEFEDWTADIIWSDETLETNQASVTVNITSAKTGDTLYDTTLKAAEWFDTANYKHADIHLSDFMKTEQGYQGAARLNIKENIHTLPFHFTLSEHSDGQTVMIGNGRINRAQFNLGQDSDPSGDWVSPEIEVAVKLVASAANP